MLNKVSFNELKEINRLFYRRSNMKKSKIKLVINSNKINNIYRYLFKDISIVMNRRESGLDILIVTINGNSAIYTINYYGVVNREYSGFKKEDLELWEECLSSLPSNFFMSYMEY